MSMDKLIALSLFANVGISEAYLEDLGVEVAVANELDPKRGRFYQHLYPNTEMIVGDITQEEIFQQIIRVAQAKKVNFILATPPCQGMSKAGKAEKNDPRNGLLTYGVRAILQLKPKYVLLENVPQQLQTTLPYGGKDVEIPQYLAEVLGEDYDFSRENLVNSADYAVAQCRTRAMFLLTRKDQGYHWELPAKEDTRRTLEQVIGHLPPLDPIIYDIPPEQREKYLPLFHKRAEQAKEISLWHKPPRHVLRQVVAMSHTPTGQSAFQNAPEYQPKKKDGTRVKGYPNTYKRQHWHKPAYTVTVYNRTIGSQNNVHPGRLEEDGRYSDPRVLSIYELMLVMSLPEQWNIPPWASDHEIRSSMGEGIPPLLLKKIMEGLCHGV